MRKLNISVALIITAVFGFMVEPAFAIRTPSVIKVGTLYASSGPFASSSMPEYNGLKFWVHQVNKDGGLYVKAFHKKIPLRLVAYDDQSETSTAATLYNQLITQNHVNVLVADFGSVLTSVAVPLAKVHRIMLFDETGTAAKFFTRSNRYVVLCSLPTSGKWPYALAGFLTHKKIDKVAIIYSSNDFDQSQAETLHRRLVKSGIKPVYYQAVPSSTTNYSVLLHDIKATNPDAVIEFGYPNNDIAFLQALQSSGLKFKMTFTVFPGQLLKLLEANVGQKTLDYTYTYPTPPLLRYNKVNLGMGINRFEKVYKKDTGKEVNFLTVAGYNTGLIIQKTLETSGSFNQSAFRKAIASFSGKVTTLDGTFKINKTGAQIGEMLPVAQLVAKSNNKMGVNVVYPSKTKTANAIYPAP